MMCLLPGREEELIASATKIASIPLLTSTLLMLLVDSPAVVCSPAALRSGLLLRSRVCGVCVLPFTKKGTPWRTKIALENREDDFSLENHKRGARPICRTV